ncbi:hypothetical protein F889_02928 [Acinetobacter colistiniresistens]|uniref:Uncharacterized protein n=1 Tax=Acinetobacter colistiniresistens TaxID=280145 RepID=N9PIT0_9GAMM|nr:virulence factor TspB C-terminal domain-related protein [Acinetobacter colistiniresistens]ENX33378.1 hypothetical protein F889_02928 [Acinetobacter colistiniresistens]
MARNLYLIFLLFTLLFTSNIYAADNGDWWLQREIQLQQNREDYARRVYGSARHTYDVVDPSTSKVKTITKNVVVEDVPSKAKLGRVLLTRGLQGALAAGAIAGMIEAVGWVMENGTWVKKKKVDLCEDDSSCPTDEFVWDCQLGGPETSAQAATACQKMLNITYPQHMTKKITGCTLNTLDLATCSYDLQKTSSDPLYKPTTSASRRKNPKYDPSKDPRWKTIPITAADVGGIASGDYKDPVDPAYDINDKQYKDVVATAYEHDKGGVADDLANQIDDRIKNAPPTSDGNPAPIGDPRYKNPPKEDEKTNDRSWGDDAGKAEGDTAPKTDPTTGEKIPGESSISLQFLVFCEWAHTMCKWYDDWKLSDKRDAKFQEDLTKHNTEEKTFWQTVKDWFTWSKDGSGLPARDDSDLNTTVDFEEKKIGLNVSPQCPAPTFETITLHGVTAQVKTSDYTYICQLDWLIKPFTIGFASVLACFILFGFNRGSED